LPTFRQFIGGTRYRLFPFDHSNEVMIVRRMVRLFLASGVQRDFDPDGAHMDVLFFMVSRWDSLLKRCQTVLTLRSQEVVSAEIQRDGVSTEFVSGAGVKGHAGRLWWAMASVLCRVRDRVVLDGMSVRSTLLHRGYRTWQRPCDSET